MSTVRSNLLFLILFIFIVFIYPSNYILHWSLNANRILLKKIWFGYRYHGPRAEFLKDGIPDGWEIMRWGRATGTYEVEKDSYGRGQVVKLERNSDRGVIALVQDVDVEPNSQIVFSVYSRGSQAAIQFRFFSTNDQEWIARGWQQIPYSVGWNEYQLSAEAPSDADRVRILLRVHGTSWFDDAFLGFLAGEELGMNVLENPGFEKDGVSGEPVEWWQRNLSSDPQPQLPQRLVSDHLGYLNIDDFLSGRYTSIRQRSQQLGKRCVFSPEMTAWLIGLGDQIENDGGVAASEQLHLLAIELAPNCPQPYSSLANLYEKNRAFPKAAELYHRAATLSSGSIIAGRYYFSEGLLHLRHTGLADQTLFAFKMAEEIKGWDRGEWYRGAASFFLGQALEEQGRPEEAAQAYRRVLECQQCNYHRASAQSRLDALVKKDASSIY